jgi:hypothetical protein
LIMNGHPELYWCAYCLADTDNAGQRPLRNLLFLLLRILLLLLM